MRIMVSKLAILHALMWDKWVCLREREGQSWDTYSAVSGTEKPARMCHTCGVEMSFLWLIFAIWTLAVAPFHTVSVPQEAWCCHSHKSTEKEQWLRAFWAGAETATGKNLQTEGIIFLSAGWPVCWAACSLSQFLPAQPQSSLSSYRWLPGFFHRWRNPIQPAYNITSGSQSHRVSLPFPLANQALESTENQCTLQVEKILLSSAEQGLHPEPESSLVLAFLHWSSFKTFPPDIPDPTCPLLPQTALFFSSVKLCIGNSALVIMNRVLRCC